MNLFGIIIFIAIAIWLLVMQVYDEMKYGVVFYNIVVAPVILLKLIAVLVLAGLMYVGDDLLNLLTRTPPFFRRS